MHPKNIQIKKNMHPREARINLEMTRVSRITIIMIITNVVDNDYDYDYDDDNDYNDNHQCRG